MIGERGGTVYGYETAHLHTVQDDGSTKQIGPMPEQAQGIVAQYRESHHRIAQLVAVGCTPSMIRAQTGVTARRLELLCADPTFRELIAGYTKRRTMKVELAADSYQDTSIANMLRAEQMIEDHLDQAEESGELIPLAQLDKISQGRADRFGYSKHTKVEHTHDFSAMLDKAIARSGKAKLIEGQVEAPRMVEVKDEAAPFHLPVSPALSQPMLQEERVQSPAPRSFSSVLEIKRRRIA